MTGVRLHNVVCIEELLSGRLQRCARALLVVFAAATLLDVVASAQAQSPASPPPISLVRYDEDYGYLRSATPDQINALSPWTSLKYIRLNKSGSVYLPLGAEVRLRYEQYRNNNWGVGPQDPNGYVWARALPLVDMHVGEKVRFFGQLSSAFALGLDVPKSPIDEDRLDVLQAFVEVRLPLAPNDQSPLELSLGRQLLSYGSGRLIDTKYGVNVLQTFDAAKAVIKSAQWQIDGFYARPAEKK